MKKVLFIAHYFPPAGGAGVQRSVKFVRYLPLYGWSPIVLTGPGNISNRWAPRDLSLASEIGPDVIVARTAPGSEVCSSQRLSDQIELGSKLIEEYQPHLIFVTMSPFEDAAIAAALSSRHHLPWVADLRDPWALDEFQVHRTWWHRRRDRQKMSAALSSAARIIMNTPEATARFVQSFPSLAHKARRAIPNGFDESDFAKGPFERTPGPFRIVHTGYLHTEAGLRQKRRAVEYALLGRTVPGVSFLSRSHYYLLQALSQWLKEAPEIAQKVQLILAGSLTPTDLEQIERSRAKSMVKVIGYLPHVDSVALLSEADVLFLPMHTLPEGRKSLIVPGKVYEYMATGIPILAAIPEGDARDFLAGSGTATICPPSDPTAILSALKTLYMKMDRAAPNPSYSNYVAQFERRRLTESLADELDSVVQENLPVTAISKPVHRR